MERRNAHCVNCNENHSAYSKSCPIFFREKEITTLKIRENIPYPEARKKFFESCPTMKGTSFASTIKKSQCTCKCSCGQNDSNNLIQNNDAQKASLSSSVNLIQSKNITSQNASKSPNNLIQNNDTSSHIASRPSKIPVKNYSSQNTSKSSTETQNVSLIQNRIHTARQENVSVNSNQKKHIERNQMMIDDDFMRMFTMLELQVL